MIPYDGSATTSYDYSRRNPTYAVTTSSSCDSTESTVVHYEDSHVLDYYKVEEPIIVYKHIHQWKLDSPVNKFVSNRIINNNRPFNRNWFINAYKSARSLS